MLLCIYMECLKNSVMDPQVLEAALLITWSAESNSDKSKMFTISNLPIIEIQLGTEIIRHV
jgi:hypothetical protein